MAWFQKLEQCLATSQSRIGNTWAQLATVRGPSSGELAGRPANRTINVRRVNANELSMVSDVRSGKARDVLEGSSKHAELCWLFPEEKTQFRISGRLELVIDGAEREKQWSEFGEMQRKWWAFPPPGSARKESEGGEIADVQVVQGKMPDHYCLCVLRIDFVEVFDQKPDPMHREHHIKAEHSNDWNTQLVHL